MKIFLVKCAAFALIAAACIGVCNYGYMRSNPYGMDMYKNVPDQIELCNVGASHSKYSFEYASYNDRYVTFNFGMDSQSHEYDYRLLQFYRDKLKEGGFVFIVVSYPMLCGKSETEAEDFRAKNRRYYTFLPKEYIREYDWKEEAIFEVIPFVNATNARQIASGLLNIQDAQGDDWRDRVMTPDEVRIDVEEAFIRHAVENKRDENGELICSQEAVDAIYGMIDLCRQEGVTPVLITPPFTVEYSTKIREDAPDLYRWFYDAVQKIQEDTGVEYYDYSEDSRFTTGDYYRFFMNGDHLNKEGARLFTDIVMTEVVGGRLP